MKRIYFQPLCQKTWGTPAVTNFVLTGTGAGAYMISLPIEALSAQAHLTGWFAAFRVLTALLTCLGFVFVAFEVRCPFRSRYLLRNLRSSWMSREILAVSVFIVAAIFEYLYSSVGAKATASVAACGLIVSQGFMAYRSKAVSSWNVPLMPILFLSSAMTAGYGLVLIWAGIVNYTLGKYAFIMGMSCVILDSIIWRHYVGTFWSREFDASTTAINGQLAYPLVLGVGHFVPFILLAMLILSSGEQLAGIVAATTGALLIFGGIMMKVGIFITAGYVREIAIDSEVPRGTNP